MTLFGPSPNRSHQLPSRPAWYRLGLLIWVLLWAVLPLASANPLPYDSVTDYLSDVEDRMERFARTMGDKHPECMPPRFRPSDLSYPYRVATALSQQCGGYHQDHTQEIKYLLLALGSLNPGTSPLIAPYAAGEVTSDTLKCVLKALVIASERLTKEQKDQYAHLVGQAFVLKDWLQFVANLPELSDPNRLKAYHAIAETAAAAYERATEAEDFATAVRQVTDQGGTAVSELLKGKARHLYDETQLAYRSCRLSEARALLPKAIEANQAACRMAGTAYRIREYDLRKSYAYDLTARRSLTDALYGGNLGLNATQQDQEFADAQRNLEWARNRLVEIQRQIDDLEGLADKLARLETRLEKTRRTYRGAQDRLHQAHDSPTACKALSELEAIVDRLQPASCRAELFHTTGDDGLQPPSALYAEVAQHARATSARRWRTLEEIEDGFRQCRIETARRAATALRQDIQEHPVVLPDGRGGCEPVPQEALLRALAGADLSVSASCAQVPETVGLAGSVAASRVQEAGLVAGLGLGNPAGAGATPGTVYRSQPPAGTWMRRGAKVALTLYGPHPPGSAQRPSEGPRGVFARTETKLFKGRNQSERRYCGGKEGYRMTLSNGTMHGHWYQDYRSCSGKYDVEANFTFTPPPASARPGQRVELRIQGAVSGMQDCCFITPGLGLYDQNGKRLAYLELSLRRLKPVKGVFQGQVSDTTSGTFTFPKGARDFWIHGRGNNGLHIGWHYVYQD